MEWDLPFTDRTKSEAKYGGHGGSKLRRFQSPCTIFTIRINMKDRVGRLRRRKLGPPLAAIFGFTRWPEDLTPDIYRAHWSRLVELVEISFTLPNWNMLCCQFCRVGTMPDCQILKDAITQFYSFLLFTMGQQRVSNIALINIERAYANYVVNNHMDRNGRDSYFF